MTCCIHFLVLLLGLVAGFKQRDFRKCDQTGFCLRGRDRAVRVFQDRTPATKWSVKDHAIKRRSSQPAALYFDILSDQTPTTHLNVKISIVEDGGIVRVQVDEQGVERYSIPAGDVIETDLQYYGDRVVEVNPAKEGEFTVLYEDYALTIEYEPFKMTLVKNGKIQIMLNHHSLFHVESKHDVQSAEASKKGSEEPSNGDSSDDSSWEAPKIVVADIDTAFNGHVDSMPKGRQSLSSDISFPSCGHLYGLPEHTTGLSLSETLTMNGRNLTVVHEPYRLYNLDVFEYELDSTVALYGAVPFVLGINDESSVGALWNNPSETWVDIGHDGRGKWGHFMSESGQIDLFLFVAENPKEILTKLAQVTGFPTLPPMFSLGYHQCRWNYKTQKDLLSVNEQFDEHGIPVDVLWLDIEHTDGKRYFTWDQKAFPEPVQMQKELERTQRHLVNIVDPHIKADEEYWVYSEMKTKGFAVLDKFKKIFEGNCWPGKSVWADFADPKVRQWWSSLYGKYSTMSSILHIWNDMNEPSVFDSPEITMPKDNLHLSGSVEHRDLHNLYGQYMHRATFEGLLEVKKERPFVLSRAFYAGTQKYGAVWTGDNAAEWDHLKVSVPMLLTLSVAGIPFVGADVGGFFGNPSADLLLRWYQTGIFYPFFRAHAHIETKRREPWLAPEPHYSHIKEAIKLRYQLLPYIYTLAYEASISGIPIIRPLFMEFPKEPKLAQIDDQLLLGSALLHKPISSPDVDSIDLVLPGSKTWFDFFTLQRIRESSMQVNLETIPLFIAGGSIVPLKMRQRRSSVPMQWDPFTLLIVLDEDGKAKGSIYIDDGKTYDFEQGASIYRTLTFSKGTLSCRPADSIVYGLKQLPKAINTKIEAIVISGFKGELPSKAIYNKKQLIIENDTESIVRIRNPPMSFFDSWDINFSI